MAQDNLPQPTQNYVSGEKSMSAVMPLITVNKAVLKPQLTVEKIKTQKKKFVENNFLHMDPKDLSSEISL
jgi:hypothetical protein